MGISPELRNSLKLAAEERQLPPTYLDGFVELVIPATDKILGDNKANEPQIFGVQGCQGSGKTTLCAFIKLYLEHAYQKTVEICSIDDFYLTKQERATLSDTRHPLLATRGVPGTHDTSLILKTLDDFSHKRTQRVPTFKKQFDDRATQDEWQDWPNSPDILIFEGWCVGISAQNERALATPVNALEQNEDPNCVWRKFVNTALEHEYQTIFQRLNSLLVIQAPSFNCVYQWRLNQEQKMIEHLQRRGEDYSQAMTPKQVERFISHYQRLTEHGLDVLPTIADATLYLNEDHSFAKTKLRTS